MNDQANNAVNETDEEILTYPVSDEVLEAAAGSEMGAAPTFFLPTGYFQCC
jgi:hypothetical protein